MLSLVVLAPPLVMSNSRVALCHARPTECTIETVDNNVHYTDSLHVEGSALISGNPTNYL